MNTLYVKPHDLDASGYAAELPVYDVPTPGPTHRVGMASARVGRVTYDGRKYVLGEQIGGTYYSPTKFCALVEVTQ